MNLFILIQERALGEEKEKISIGLIRNTARDDLHMIQPMIKAIRDKNLKEIAKYDDISLDLDNVLINYERHIDLNERVQELFKDRKHSVEAIKRNTVENLVIDLMAIFVDFKTNEMRMLCEKLVEKASIDEDYNFIKKKALKEAMNIENKNEKDGKKSEKKQLKAEGLLTIYEVAKNKKEHPYEELKRNGFIKNPVDEFLNVNYMEVK